MAHSQVPEVGPLAPCDDCSHRDCAESRRVVASICQWCGNAIGFDRDYCRDDEGKPEHFWCAIEAAEHAGGPA